MTEGLSERSERVEKKFFGRNRESRRSEWCRAVRALLAGDAQKALQTYRFLGPAGPPMAYAASKIAVSRWVRRNATTQGWAGAGIRLNALAPGAIMTPLLERQLATPAEAEPADRMIDAALAHNVRDNVTAVAVEALGG